MKLIFDAGSLDLGYRTVPMADLQRLTIETDRRRGWLVRGLVILAVLLGLGGLFKVLGSDRPGWAFLGLCGCLALLAVKSWHLVEAVSDQEKFHTLWAHVPEGKVRLLSVGDLDFAERVRAAVWQARTAGGTSVWEVDPAWSTIEERPRPALPAGSKAAGEA